MSGTLTKGSSNSVQIVLRADPKTAFENYGFFVTSDVYKTGTVGGACLIGCEKANGSVYHLTAKAGFGDFFFPYVHITSGGVGSCVVPIGQVDGTMAITGGMNGCALQVNKHAGNFYFYHDANGTSMAGKVYPGTEVCRVQYRTYAGPLNIGENLSKDFLKNNKGGNGGMVHEYYLITVRKGGRWYVYVSALLRTSIRKTAFWSGNAYNDITFSPFTPTITTLMTSFEDS